MLYEVITNIVSPGVAICQNGADKRFRVVLRTRLLHKRQPRRKKFPISFDSLENLESVGIPELLKPNRIIHYECLHKEIAISTKIGFSAINHQPSSSKQRFFRTSGMLIFVTHTTNCFINLQIIGNLK